MSGGGGQCREGCKTLCPGLHSVISGYYIRAEYIRAEATAILNVILCVRAAGREGAVA